MEIVGSLAQCQHNAGMWGGGGGLALLRPACMFSGTQLQGGNLANYEDQGWQYRHTSLCLPSRPKAAMAIDAPINWPVWTSFCGGVCSGRWNVQHTRVCALCFLIMLCCWQAEAAYTACLGYKQKHGAARLALARLKLANGQVCSALILEAATR